MRTLLYAVIITPMALGCATLAGWFARGTFERPFWARILAWWGGGFVRSCGVTAVDGSDDLSQALALSFAARKPVILVSSHASYLDSLILISRSGCPLRFVAKKELRRVPFLGSMMTATGQIFIDRSDPRGAVAAMRDAGIELARTGGVVVVYPEGTRGRPDALLPFKLGAFVMAKACHGAQILPVYLHGTRAVWPDTLGWIRPGSVEIHVGAPLDVGDSGADMDTEELAVEKLRVKAEAVVRELRAMRLARNT